MNRKTEEERDLENRKRNIIIYRVPEKKIDNVPERKASDAVFVKDLLDGVFNMTVEENEIEKVFRLGRWTEDKARPLLVAFKNVEQKEYIMANLRNLRQPIEKFRGLVYLTICTLKKERKLNSRLRKRSRNISMMVAMLWKTTGSWW